MINIVMKPVPGAGVENNETLYFALFNGKDLGLRIRGLRASHAEAKLMEVFEENISRKAGDDGTFTVSFNLEEWLGVKRERKDDDERDKQGRQAER